VFNKPVNFVVVEYCRRNPGPEARKNKQLKQITREVERAAHAAQDYPGNAKKNLCLVPIFTDLPVTFPNLNFISTAKYKAQKPGPPMTWDENIPHSGISSDGVPFIHYLPNLVKKGAVVCPDLSFLHHY
jgi:hypothetical protein